MKLLPFALPLFALPLSAQTWSFQSVAKVGDNVGGVGAITSVRSFTMDSPGEWRLEVDTNGPSPSNRAVIGPSGVIYQEGQMMTAPVGTNLSQFLGLACDQSGYTATILRLAGTSGSIDDTAIYRDQALLAQEGGTSSATNLGPGTTYGAFYELKVAGNGDVLMLGQVDDPTIPTTADQVLLRFTTDAAGSVISESAVWKEGDTVPGTSGQVTGVLNSPHSFDVNDSGEVIMYIKSNLPTQENGFILLGNQIVAQKGHPSPVTGRDWLSVGSTEVTLNNTADYAFSGVLTGNSASNLLLVRNGSKFRQEGDPVPGVLGANILTFGTGPIDLADTGELLWYARWSGSTSNQDEGLFVEHSLVVQEGVTQIGGVTVDTLYGSEEKYAISDDGSAVMFEAILADGTHGIFRATRPTNVATFPGCSGEEGALFVASGLPVQGTTMQLTYSNPSSLVGSRQLAMSGVSWADPNGCGLVVPGIGEILLSILPQDLVLLPMGTHTGSEATLPLPISTDPAYLGVTLYFQAVFIFPSDPVNPVDLSNGISLTIS